MWPDAGTPYLDMYAQEIRSSIRRKNRRSNRHDTPVVHHETCPCCGRKLVNLYLKDGQWQCKACWDKEAANVSEKSD